MITLPILIVGILLFAWKEAVDDDSAIDKTNKEGTKFSHYDPDRYIVAGVFTLIMAGFAQTWWALLYFPITWAVFTISFRFLLNRKRGKHWLYVSPSNGYDRIWLRLSHWSVFGCWPRESTLQFDNRLYLDKSRRPVSDYIHRAGAFAHSFEAFVVLIPSVTIYILNITKTL